MEEAAKEEAKARRRAKAAEVPFWKQNIHQLALTDATLVDTKDTVEELREQAVELAKATDQLGKSCHATAVIADRTGRLMELKANCLQELGDKEVVYIRATEERVAVLEAMMQGDDPDIDSRWRDFSNFPNYHKNCHSMTLLESKGRDFEMLLANMRLPPKHEIVLRSEEFIEESRKLWGSSALEVVLSFTAKVLEDFG